LVALPPASVAKSITSLYALDALGPGYRFATKLIGTGPVADGVLQGDLILAGGGDPVLNTDHLVIMAERLKQAGIRSVRGAFKVWGGALPAIHEIDPAQMAHLDYNPAIGGLNLNFNRVYFEWVRSGGQYNVSMDARTDLVRPTVSMARMRVVDRDLPVYTFAETDGRDDWTVARSALGANGSRWLPVRQPAIYAGDVFRVLARAQGIELAEVGVADSQPTGAELVRLLSDPLDDIIRDMLKYSTNLTAETLGLSATVAQGGRPLTLADSARAMTRWAATALGVDCSFVDHSGLGDASHISAGQMVKTLVAAGPMGLLRSLMKDIVLTDIDGEALPNPPATVVAKTGTLNFVSALAGYIRTTGGADLCFAIFCADPDSRATALQSDDEIPDGARDWNHRAKRLQQELLQRWSVVYAG
jgi:serine-type D-Ala-D-Ala carboxypeptidase/endopeptidase (penicillin-binding protein 4)